MTWLHSTLTSPAPLQAAQVKGKLGFGQASDQIKFAPKAQLTATIDNWGPYYVKKVGQVMNGTWQTGTTLVIWMKELYKWHRLLICQKCKDESC